MRINTNKISYILVAFLLLIGLFMRVYNLEERTIFDADQEWLAGRARDMVNGDIPLLGPVTSIGSFSIGPGFIYLWAIVGFLTGNDPVSGAYLSVILGVLTCFAVFLFTKYFIDKKVALVMLFLTTFSAHLIFWDQWPWAPSLFLLAQIILLAGTYISTTDESGYLLMALGLILGFQSHFGIVLSLISIVFYLILVRPVKPKKKTVLISFLILALGLLPNIVFDVTHDFINIKRFMGILVGDGQDYFISIGKIFDTLSYNVSTILYPKSFNHFDSIVIKSIFILLVVNGLRLLSVKSFKNLSLLLLVTVVVPSMFFYLNQGKFSEYYLIMTVPSLIFLLAFLLKNLVLNNYVMATILIVSAILNYKDFLQTDISWNLKAKKEIVEEIIKLGGHENYGISLSIKNGYQFGFKYLFEYYNVRADIPPKSGENKIFTIVIPEGFDGMVGLKDFDGIGLIWQGI